MKNKLTIITLGVSAVLLAGWLLGILPSIKSDNIQDPITTTTSGMNIEQLGCLKGKLRAEKLSLVDTTGNSIDYDNQYMNINNKIINDVDKRIKDMFDKANKRVPNTIQVIQLPLN